MPTIDINQLTDAVNEILVDYGNEISKGTKIAAEEVAKETVKQLKQSSPKNQNGSKRGYARSWKSETQTTRLGSSVTTIFNSKNWRLTHLLENGHLARNGKRVPAIPHIAPAEEAAIKEFERKVRELI